MITKVISISHLGPGRQGSVAAIIATENNKGYEFAGINDNYIVFQRDAFPDNFDPVDLTPAEAVSS